MGIEVWNTQKSVFKLHSLLMFLLIVWSAVKTTKQWFSVQINRWGSGIQKAIRDER